MTDQITDFDYILEGNEFINRKDLTRAAISYLDAIRINPNNETAYCNLGNIYLDIGQLKSAVKCYKKAISIKPNYANAICNLGATYGRKGELKKALTCYQKVIEIEPNHPLVYIFLGNIMLAQGSYDEAEMCYKMGLEKDNSSVQAHNNLGTAYAKKQQYGNAVKEYKKALKIDPNFSMALTNLATAYTAADKTELALKFYKESYEADPDNSSNVANLYHQLKAAAEWDNIKNIENKLDRLTKKEIAMGVKTGEEPFINIIRTDDKEQNLKLATLWSKNLNEGITHQKKFKYANSKRDHRVRIGYYSAHFHDHPTGHLIQKLFSLHNRDIFEVYIYSCGPDDESIYYNNIKFSADKFTDLTSVNFADSAQMINEDQIDILIDLDGYTDNNRLEVLALRPAPIQVTYLGFPGTTGSNFIDYLIADKVVVPQNHRKFYSENLVYLPPTYQVNDSSQKITKGTYPRSKFSLPENVFIFCCFNGSYKIEPESFEAWMNILKRVPKSVLWLLKTNKTADINLKEEAKKRNLNPNRLIFANRMPRNKHIKRLALADLALDTFTVNGHTTTSDMLWAGVPVITLQGKHFASRVASSILTSVGLTDLISKNKKDYEDLAVKLALFPSKLKKIKTELNSQRSSAALFNTEVFANHFNNALIKMWEIYKTGKLPEQITVNG